MNITDKISLFFRKATKKELSQVTAGSFSGGRQVLASRSKPMLLSAVYRCVDLISDSIAVLPLIVYRKDSRGFKAEATNHPCYQLLNLEPNEDMTRYVFMKTMATSVLLRGNAYAYIERDSRSEVQQLVYIPADEVDIEFVPDGNGIPRKRYRVNGFKSLVEPKDMIHILNFTYDGIKGVSTLTHAAQTLGIATAGEEHVSEFLQGGGAVTGTLKVEGARLSKEQKDDIYNVWNSRTNPISGNRNGLVILEHNMTYTPIAVSPKDAQLLESRAFTTLEVGRFFSVNPIKLFDLSKSSYATVEATQLQYLTDTALAIITKFEQEIQRKVFLRSEQDTYVAEFDTSVILRTDKAAQAAYWRDMSNIGAATPNEIRRPMNLPPLPAGDNAFIQINMQTLDAAVAASEQVITTPAPIEEVKPKTNTKNGKSRKSKGDA